MPGGKEPYRKGREHENKVQKLLEKEGYYVVRAAGSKGIVDLLAVEPMNVLFVQCRKSSKMTPAERAELVETAQLYGGVPILFSGDVAYLVKKGGYDSFDF